MRTPKPEWLAALRSACGDEVRLSWNDTAKRWQFDVLCVDGQYRPQFYQWTHDPLTGAKLDPGPQGLLPMRELDDAGMREVLRNLEVTYLGNPHDGAQTPERLVAQRERYNKDLWRSKHRQAAQAWVDLMDERKRRLRGGLLIGGSALPKGAA